MASPSSWVSRSTASLGPAARRQPGVQCEDRNGRENQTGLQIDQEYLANWNEKETDCLPTGKNPQGGVENWRREFVWLWWRLRSRTIIRKVLLGYLGPVGRVVRVTDLGGKSDQLMVAEIQRSPSIQDGMETSPALPGNKCNESVCDEQGRVIGRSFSRAAVIITVSYTIRLCFCCHLTSWDHMIHQYVVEFEVIYFISYYLPTYLTR